MKVEKIVSKRSLRYRPDRNDGEKAHQSELFKQRWDGKWIPIDVNFEVVSDVLVSPPWALSEVVSVRTVPSSD